MKEGMYPNRTLFTKQIATVLTLVYQLNKKRVKWGNGRNLPMEKTSNSPLTFYPPHNTYTKINPFLPF